MAHRRSQGPPVGAYPKHAILALAAYRESIETWQQIAGDRKRPKDERKMAIYYLAVAFGVDYETLTRTA